MGKEEKSAFYDKAYLKSEEYAKEPQQSIYYDLWVRALRKIKPMERIYDLGCGTGQFAQYALNNGWNITRAIDFSRTAIEKAQKRNPNYKNIFFIGDLYNKKIYEYDNYDTVILIEVLEHLQNDMFVLQNILKGKRIVFSLPSYDCEGHVRWFTKPEEIKNRYEQFVEIIDFEKLLIEDKYDCWLFNTIKK